MSNLTNSRSFAVLAVAAFAAVALAGCTSDAVEPTQETKAAGGAVSQAGAGAGAAVTVGDRDLRTGLLATDELGPPQWRVGDFFGHHVFFGPDDEEGTHFSTIVVGQDADSWILASDQRDSAIVEAVFDIPILGKLAKKDLSTTSFGGEFSWYDFPLRDGKTWARDWTGANPATGEGTDFTVQYTATYATGFKTQEGPRPGFKIVGTVDDQVFLEYDYVPAMGWYTEARFYNLATPDVPDDFELRVISMGVGNGWTGTYYLDTAEVLTEHLTWTYPWFDPTAPDPAALSPDEARAAVQPNPHAMFTVPEGTTTVWGWFFSYAFAGVQETLVIDPDGTKYEAQAAGFPEGEASGSFDVPAVPGEWRIVSPGAAAISVGGVFLWGITETTATL